MGLFYRLTRIHSSTVFTKVSTHSSQSFARITSREVKGKNLWVVTVKIKLDSKLKTVACTIATQNNSAFVYYKTIVYLSTLYVLSGRQRIKYYLPFSIVSSLLRQSSEKYIWFKEQINESISDNVVLLTTCCNLITLFV